MSAGAGGPTGRGPVLVELVGAAGAGKSTVFERLLERDGTLEPMPLLSRRPYTLLLVRHLMGVLLMLARHRALRRWTWRQLVAMAYLEALPRALAGDGSRPSRTVVFDQGPIFFLTRPSLQDPRIRPWADRTFEAWADLLDVVVWLDAPDDVLRERIDARSKDHRIKGGHDEAVFSFLAESRAVYASTVARARSATRPPVVLSFDTSRRSADAIVEDVLAALARDARAERQLTPDAGR